MKKSSFILLLLVGLTLTFAIGIAAYAQMEAIPVKMMVIYGLIGVVALLSIAIAIKNIIEEKEGQPIEDEFTTLVKYMGGYYAYVASLYMWLFLFLFKDFFPDIETLLGGGILLSGVIGFICRIVVKRKFNAE